MTLPIKRYYTPYRRKVLTPYNRNLRQQFKRRRPTILRKYLKRGRPPVGRAQGLNRGYYPNRNLANRVGQIGEKLHIQLLKRDQEPLEIIRTGEKATMRLYNIGTTALETGFTALGGVMIMYPYLGYSYFINKVGVSIF